MNAEQSRDRQAQTDAEAAGGAGVSGGRRPRRFWIAAALIALNATLSGTVLCVWRKGGHSGGPWQEVRRQIERPETALLLPRASGPSPSETALLPARGDQTPEGPMQTQRPADEASAQVPATEAKRQEPKGAPAETSEEFARSAERFRESMLLHLEPKVVVPNASRSSSSGGGSYAWKRNIVTIVFAVGERGSRESRGRQTESAWDPKWERNYGGFDDPEPAHRRNYVPASFVPKRNPFYCALPYNDVGKGRTKPEAQEVIPWFKNAFVKDGQSVCVDRWVEIRGRTGRACYAQWEDCGPFRTDHWQYVFGNELPKPNAMQGSGLEVSPAVRDYLALARTDVTDWRFVEFREIPKGPWGSYGENNTFVQSARGAVERVASAGGAEGPPVMPSSAPAEEKPQAIAK